ncbi:hypothetical protein CEXT_658121 [Caerostris extrusa]|uniref:Uncharacterized protein n=1 Tax=Caerostris extrusa TaxID=172846 RepID=A0AAV4TGM8_CAEEX|nr:hypothetical protein CEXT_658121 [Caerostris extrusa]
MQIAVPPPLLELKQLVRLCPAFLVSPKRCFVLGLHSQMDSPVSRLVEENTTNDSIEDFCLKFRDKLIALCGSSPHTLPVSTEAVLLPK